MVAFQASESSQKFEVASWRAAIEHQGDAVAILQRSGWTIARNIRPSVSTREMALDARGLLACVITPSAREGPLFQPI